MTFPETDGGREFAKQQEYIARERARFDARDAARAAEAVRLAAIEREAEVCGLAKDLLLKLAAAETSSPVEFLPGQAFSMADHFYRERDRRAAAIK